MFKLLDLLPRRQESRNVATLHCGRNAANDARARFNRSVRGATAIVCLSFIGHSKKLLLLLGSLRRGRSGGGRAIDYGTRRPFTDRNVATVGRRNGYDGGRPMARRVFVVNSRHVVFEPLSAERFYLFIIFYYYFVSDC